ncbi:MAG: sensor histidine kinase [Spirochaetota bacterium]
MKSPDPIRLLPLGLLALLHGAALFLALQTLSHQPEAAQAAYVPALLILGFALGAGLVIASPQAFPASLVLVIWSMAVQLVLIPPGFTTTFRLLVLAPVLVQTVLTLHSAWGPALATIELCFFLLGQGNRRAWGLDVTAADAETLVGMGAMGLALVGGSWGLRAAFRKRVEAEAEVAHLRDAVQQIILANVGFQELATAVEETSMRQERLRITREIHDIVGYTLTNQTMVLQAAAVLLDRDHDKLRELLSSAEESARSGLEDVRQALRQLRIGTEQPMAFLNRVHQLCRTFERATSVKVQLSGAQIPDKIPPALELVLYRMIQEGLTNVFIHGKATRVSVGLGLDADELSLRLSDDGLGAEEVTEGIGLAGMRERLAPFGGTLDYQGSAHGFTVWALIPRASLGEERGVVAG